MSIDFQQAAYKARSFIVFLFSTRIKDRTASEKAALLTHNAIKLGLIAPRDPVKGHNLKAWQADRSGKNIQHWVVSSAVDCLVNYADWRPETRDELLSYASTLTRLYPLVDEVDRFQKLVDPDIWPALAPYLALAQVQAQQFRPDGYRRNLKALRDEATDHQRIGAVLSDANRAVTLAELAFTAFPFERVAMKDVDALASQGGFVSDHYTIEGEPLHPNSLERTDSVKLFTFQ
uniref:hypothetical protein n=1 Tax=Thaumasiovibrio occultus TaxID=1891184 RepID=UPI000B3631C2|nr:hypothetical protein [Thaumasiovibrio occultus]